MRSFITEATRPQPQPRETLHVTVSVRLDADIVRLVDRLVDAIDVRESYEPEIAGWDTDRLIRRLERELAEAWPREQPRSDPSVDEVRS